jgi:hypothetical protein
MLDLGATTTWESDFALERSQGCCFGFAAHPLNYMIRNLLGVIPLEPGHRRFSVRIAPQGLEYAQGKVATPYGYIEVSWKRIERGLEIDLVVPEGCEAVVAPPRVSSGTSSVQSVLNGAPVNLVSQPVATCSFLREDLPACSVGPGQSKIRFTFD